MKYLRKSFNINGLCYPDENYMVNLDERLKEMKKLVDEQKYFVINRARQYGKTTLLWALKQYLQQEYIVISMSFQRMSSTVFEQSFPYNPNNYMINIGVMFGFIVNRNGQAVVANRIFETWLYNLFMSEEMMNDESYR